MSRFTILSCLLVVAGISALVSGNKETGVICLLLGVVLSGSQMSMALSSSDKQGKDGFEKQATSD